MLLGADLGQQKEGKQYERLNGERSRLTSINDYNLGLTQGQKSGKWRNSEENFWFCSRIPSPLQSGTPCTDWLLRDHVLVTGRS